MANDKQNLQDAFLNHVRKAKTPVTVFLINGVKLQGVITWFDNFCVLLRRDGQVQLVYKHAISTVMTGPADQSLRRHRRGLILRAWLVHPDIADRASSETDRSIELRARDRQRKLIAKIDAALERVADGSYGYCIETGEPISLKRLEARPIATLSLEAQEAHERREKVYRDD